MTWSSRWRSSGPARSRATWSIPICAAARARSRSYPKPELEKVLGKTLGVPLFQEQAMRVAIECAGFTPGEADQLRRAMATFKFTGGVSHFKDKLVGGMVARGYEEDFAEQTFSQLEGFGSYGFPESHAASFALLAYASSWLKCHHPEVFCAALLNSQPMGFYQPAQIVRDAQEHGVEVRPICVNASRWDCTLEDKARRVAGGAAGPADGRRPGGGRRRPPGAGPGRRALPFDRRGLAPRRDQDRRPVAAGRGRRLPAQPQAGAARGGLGDQGPARHRPAVFDQPGAAELNEPPPRLKAMTEGREIVEDYSHVGLSLRRHPLALLRPDLEALGRVPCRVAAEARDGRFVKTAGLVLVRQMPGTAKGVLFMTIEDETGASNLVIWKTLYEKQRRIALGAHLIGVDGRIQREGDVVHLVAYQLHDLSGVMGQTAGSRDRRRRPVLGQAQPQLLLRSADVRPTQPV
jgi:error-prone DNA polymerase